MYNYCTLFNSNYLTRGLAMYESLKKNTKNFHLFIFAFDDMCYEILHKLNLDFVTIISLKEFEDEDLLKVKNDRTGAEYCWTATPSAIKYCIEKYNLENCTYVDADVYFFCDPSFLINEMGDKSVLVTEHRYTPEYDQSSTSGIYCVQFLTFKNDENGMEVLNWWSKACLEWCYNRFEDGKFGDQKYLDDWPTRFKGIHILQHPGGGVASWNIQQYKLEENPFELIFYHFHGLKFLPNNKVDLGPYRLRKEDIKIIYKPYLLHLEDIRKRIEKLENRFKLYIESKKFYDKSKPKKDWKKLKGYLKLLRKDWKTLLKYAKRKIKKVSNIYELNEILEL